MLLLLVLIGLGIAPAAFANTFYVRTDGGTAAQCTGLANAPYPGTGSNQACAWANPMVALPPPLYGGKPQPRIAGGDTLLIGPGQYMIGLGAPGADNCNTGALGSCMLAPVPSGPSAAQPTRVLGTVCTAGQQPQLWGNRGPYSMVNLTSSSNVEVGCLEITDHSSCVVNHCSMAGTCKGQINVCKSTDPFAQNGIVGSDSQSVSLHDLNIHGMGNEGVRAGRLTNWSMQRMRIVGNGFAGWDNDIRNGISTADTSNHGTISFTNVEIGFNGCGETWPGLQIFGCWGQNEGGYGDGLGTGPTSGNWVFESVYVHHNTQDGLDLLYADGTGSISMDRVHAEGNAGNQLKVAGATTITNSVVIGDCSYFSQPWSQGSGNMQLSDDCRAGGDAIAMLAGNDQHPGESSSINHVVTSTIKNNTIIGEGNGLIMLSRGNPVSTVNFVSNVLYGTTNWQLARSGYPELAGGIYYYATTGYSAPTMNYAGNLFWNVKNGQCPSGSLCKDPQFTVSSVYAFNPLPMPTSPLIGSATAANSTTVDFRGYLRPSSVDGLTGYDIGAIQYQGMADNRIFQSNFD
ncbi:MAG: hypothetical protein JSR27_13240 [Proteobacteria bacterium]|nr:hypothetical protein [Pseudomonadota bacterium]